MGEALLMGRVGSAICAPLPGLQQCSRLLLQHACPRSQGTNLRADIDARVENISRIAGERYRDYTGRGVRAVTVRYPH